MATANSNERSAYSNDDGIDHSQSGQDRERQQQVERRAQGQRKLDHIAEQGAGELGPEVDQATPAAIPEEIDDVAIGPAPSVMGAQ